MTQMQRRRWQRRERGLASEVRFGGRSRNVPGDDRYSRFQRLIEMGKERGYVLYDDVSELLPDDIGASGDLDDLLAGLDAAGVDLLEEPRREEGRGDRRSR